jgi:(heptosyl)LPS beta-1,4-glucosyltransferase
MRPSLSVVVITKNEEDNLPNFLLNVSYIADEIVIIDDGSTDRTAVIALSAGEQVRFISSPRTDGEGFSDQRNKGVAAAKGDWLLQVDCDMRITPEFADEVLEAIKRQDKAAYRFQLKQYFLNHHVRFGGFQYWNQPWLVQRSAIRWTQKLHERANIDAAPEQIGQLNHRMVHLNDAKFTDRLRKNFQYSHLEAERLLARGRAVTLLDLVAQPLWRAFRSYILMRGFLDGRIGFVWSLYQFTGTVTAYYIAWERSNRRSRQDNEASISSSFCSKSSQLPGAGLFGRRERQLLP